MLEPFGIRPVGLAIIEEAGREFLRLSWKIEESDRG
jgi:hypothetical protein